MASTITKLVATPHRVKYLVNSDGALDVTRTRAQILADCVTGPLKDLLTAVAAGAAWDALPNTDKLSLVASARTASCGANFEQSAGDVLKAYVCGVGVSTIEIVFLHSATR